MKEEARIRRCVIGCACACAGDDGGHRLPEQGHKPGVLIPSPAKIYALPSLAVTHLQRASVTHPRCPSPSTIGHRYRSVPAHKGLDDEQFQIHTGGYSLGTNVGNPADKSDPGIPHLIVTLWL